MAFVEDLRPYFADFAEDVVIGGVAGAAIFDDAFRTVLDGAVATSGPVLTIRSADFAPALVGAPATVRQVSYTIVGQEPDGTGVTTLRLEKA